MKFIHHHIDNGLVFTTSENNPQGLVIFSSWNKARVIQVIQVHNR